MAKSSLFKMLFRLLRSSQGQRAVSRAQQMANRPETRNALAKLLRRFGGRR